MILRGHTFAAPAPAPAPSSRLSGCELTILLNERVFGDAERRDLVLDGSAISTYGVLFAPHTPRGLP